MIQKWSKPITSGRSAWRDSQQQTTFQRERKHASESTAGGPKKPHAWHAPPHTSAEQLLTILLQLNINGLQEALSCYSMLVKYSLMHMHTELPHMALLCFHSARRANDAIWPLHVAWFTEDRLGFFFFVVGGALIERVRLKEKWAKRFVCSLYIR